MTTLTETPDLVGVETHADGMPVIKKTAVTAAAPAPAEASTEPVRPVKDWYSGWCSGGVPKIGKGCLDGKQANKVGEPIVNCRYIGENGEKVPNRFVYCSCACHDGNRVPEDPKFVEKN